MRRVRDAARYADQQPLSSGRRFMVAVAGSVAVAVAMGTIGLYVLVSGDPDDRGAAAGVLVGFVAFLVMPAVLVVRFSDRYRARSIAAPTDEWARSSSGRLPWLFVGAMALVAVGVWQILSDAASAGVLLIAIAGAAVALVVGLLLRADGR